MIHTGKLSVLSSYPTCSRPTSFGFCETLEKGCPKNRVGSCLNLFRQFSSAVPFGQPAQNQKGHPSMVLSPFARGMPTTPTTIWHCRTCRIAPLYFNKSAYWYRSTALHTQYSSEHQVCFRANTSCSGCIGSLKTIFQEDCRRKACRSGSHLQGVQGGVSLFHGFRTFTRYSDAFQQKHSPTGWPVISRTFILDPRRM